MKHETDTATVDWEEKGEGQPIVFLHGWTMNRQVEIEVYEPIFSKRPGWLRIYPDLPGMGLSVAKSVRNQDDVLAAMLAFLDHRLAGAPFVLAGASLGGYLARAIAARRRAQVRGLLLRVPAIIADTAKRTLPGFEPLVRNERVMAALDPGERAAMGPMLVEAKAYVETARRRFRTLVQPAIDGTAPWAVEMRGDPARYGFSFDLAAEESFAKPALVIVARQDTTVGYRDAWAIVESYPRATFAVIDRATHGWPTESTDLLAALVDDWLERIEKAEQSI